MMTGAKIFLSLPVLALLTACVGIDELLDRDDYIPVRSLPDVTEQTLVSNLGAHDRQPVSAIGARNAMTLRPAEMVNAQISFNNSRLNSNGSVNDANVTITSDRNGDGVLDTSMYSMEDIYSENLNAGNMPEYPNEFTSDNITIGGENVSMVRQNGIGYGAVIYVPANQASRMYGGAYIHHNSGGGFSGVFGRRTTTEDMSAQGGTVTYRGVAAATLTRGGLLGEAGLFEGNATATVNFDNRTFNTNATMSRKNFRRPGTSTIGVRGSGVVNNNGTIAGTANLIGAGTAMTGNMRGRFYGSNAETMGAVFTANGSDPSRQIDPENTNASGVLLMNR